MVRFFQYIIRGYSYIVSPFLGRNCRFHPTCSSYASQALEKHGVLKGLYLAISRILCCQPWSKRNYDDPVPERFAWKEILRYKRACLLRQTELSKLNNKYIKGSGDDE